MPVPKPINLNDAVPAPPTGRSNVRWQADNADPRNVSAYALIGGVNPQTGTSYTIAASDHGRLLTLNNASAVAVTLPQASTLPSGFWLMIENLGAGAVTITPTTSTIDGAPSLTLQQKQGVVIFSNGVNYFTMRGVGVPETRRIDTTLPLTGGGDLSQDRTLAIDNFVGDSGSGGAKGAVPAPAAGDAAAGKYLKADGNWAVPPSSSGGVPPTRRVDTTAPLTGGGDLSQDRTLAIDDFVGDSGLGGLSGAVPAPAPGDAAANKFLHADGSFRPLPSENSTGYTLSPNPCLSQPAGQAKVAMAAVSAYFSDRTVTYQARQFNVLDPGTGGIQIPAGQEVPTYQIQLYCYPDGSHTVLAQANGVPLTVGSVVRGYDWNGGFGLVPQKYFVVDEPLGGYLYRLHLKGMNPNTFRNAVKALEIASPGTGYAVNDVLTVGGGTAATIKITSVGGSGQVLGFDLLTNGDGYLPAYAAPVYGGSGSGLTLNITTGGKNYGGSLYGGARRFTYQGPITSYNVTEGGEGWTPGDIACIRYPNSPDRIKVVTVTGGMNAINLSTLVSSRDSATGINLPLFKLGSSVVNGRANITAVAGTSMVLIPSVENSNFRFGQTITITGMDDSSFNGDVTLVEVYTQDDGTAILGYFQDGSPGYSGNGEIVGSGGQGAPLHYYVTIYDPDRVGDANGSRPAYCELTADKVGAPGYIYMGSIYVTHAGGSGVVVTPGGWAVGSGGSSILEGQTAAITTGTIAVGSYETGSVTMCKLGALTKALADDKCRLRLYSTAAGRDADVSRAEGVAADDVGLLYEQIWGDTAPLSWLLQPIAWLRNRDASLTTTIYYTVNNKLAVSHSFSITLTFDAFA